MLLHSVVGDATTYSYMDVAFFSGLNRNTYGNLMNKVQNAFWMGINEYPRDLNLEYNLEINWRGDSMPEVRSPNNRAAFYTKKEVETQKTTIQQGRSS